MTNRPTKSKPKNGKISYSYLKVELDMSIPKIILNSFADVAVRASLDVLPFLINRS